MTAEFMVAVHALEYLYHKGTCLSSEELAANVCTNPARVRKVLAKLERAGLASSRSGFQGGYVLERPPEEVTLLAVFDAVCDRLVKTPWRSGDVDMDCAVASGMAGVMDGVMEDVERGGREALARVTLADIDRRLFGGKTGAAE